MPSIYLSTCAGLVCLTRGCYRTHPPGMQRATWAGKSTPIACRRACMQCDDGACFSYPGVIVRASRMIVAIYTYNQKSIHSSQQHRHCDHARRIRSDGVQAGANNNNAMSPPSAAETYAATSPVRLSWCCAVCERSDVRPVLTPESVRGLLRARAYQTQLPPAAAAHQLFRTTARRTAQSSTRIPLHPEASLDFISSTSLPSHIPSPPHNHLTQWPSPASPRLRSAAPWPATPPSTVPGPTPARPP